MATEALARYWPAWLIPERRRRAERMLEELRDQISRDHKNLVRELRELRRTAEQNQARIDSALAAHEQALAVLPELQARVDQPVVHVVRKNAIEDDVRTGVGLQFGAFNRLPRVLHDGGTIDLGEKVFDVAG